MWILIYHVVTIVKFIELIWNNKNNYSKENKNIESTIAVEAGFSLAAYYLHGQINDWDAHQTITTLDSIATPIQQVQFPTVTVRATVYFT